MTVRADDQVLDPLIHARPVDRIRLVDDTRRVRIPLKNPWENGIDIGQVSPSYPMEHMVLVLRSDADQMAELERLTAAQQDSQSALYHHWVTPQTFGAHFGVSERDLAAVAAWLRAYGFAVEPLPAGRRWLLFSGTAANVEAAFHTQIHTYLVNGEIHHANSMDPEIPEAFAGVVAGPLSFSDYRSKPPSQPSNRDKVTPKGGTAANQYLAPSDFAAIYDLLPLYALSSPNLGYNGQGVGIAVVARSNLQQSDIALFQQQFGTFTFVVETPYGDPGLTEDLGLEATLDVTRAGSVAPGAGTILVPVGSTNATDGVVLSAQYIVDMSLAAIVTDSYGECEPALVEYMPASFYQDLWAQAVNQGMSVFVISGDTGANGCERDGDPTPFLAVNGYCTPGVVCVGGTQFNDTTNPAAYWSTGGNALGYIPENVWNDGQGDASGGGVSALYTKPSWQQGVTRVDGARDEPDVSLSASWSQDPYLLYFDGSQTTNGGTSASAPSFAGIMAVVLSAARLSRWGNPAPELYSIAQSSNNVFHLTVGGNNSVPGLTGYNATAEICRVDVGCIPVSQTYNLATGLGSVDAAALAAAWPGTYYHGQSFQYLQFPTPPNQSLSVGTVSLAGAATTTSLLPIQFASTTTSVCTVSGSTVTLLQTGVCTIQASQPGGGFWEAALTITRGFQVFGACDVTVNSSGQTGVADVQKIINEALGTLPPVNDLTADGFIGVADVQVVVNSAMGTACTFVPAAQ